MAFTITPLISIITIPYEELEGSRRETMNDQGEFVGVMTIQCYWESRIALAEQIRGYYIFNGDNTIYYLPQQYPDAPGAFASKIDIQGWGHATQVSGAVNFLQYEYARLTIEFKYLEYAQSIETPEEDEIPLVSLSVRPSTEFLTLPNKSLYWSDGVAVNADQCPGLLIRMVDIVYKFFALPKIPTSVFTLVGLVNSSAISFKSLPISCAPGTLLFGDPVLDVLKTNRGQKGWEVELTYTYRQNGWNKFPRVNTSTGAVSWEFLYADSSQTVPVNPYQGGDFSEVVSLLKKTV